MLRDPKDVAGEVLYTVEMAPQDDYPWGANVIRRDRAAVIAEAKRLVDTAFEKNWVVQDLLDALDNIVEE